MPEAEGELVAGFHTEYSSLKFAMFMLAEYVNMMTVSSLASVMFFGGWHAPWPINMWAGANTGWWPVLWFTAKMWTFLFIYIWLRASLPRLRYDQFMALGWKLLIPASLVWVMIAAVIRTPAQPGLRALDPGAGGQQHRLRRGAGAAAAKTVHRSQRSRDGATAPQARRKHPRRHPEAAATGRLPDAAAASQVRARRSTWLNSSTPSQGSA